MAELFILVQPFPNKIFLKFFFSRLENKMYDL